MADEWTNLETEFAPTRPSSRKLWGGAAVLAVLVVGSLALFWLDPFGWHIVERLTGRYDAAIQAIPADSPAYVGVNLLEVNRERLAALQKAFARAAPELDEEAARANLDEMLMAELGLSLEEDVLSWIGQYAGFGLISVDTDADSAAAAAQWIVSVESRNREAGDAFLQKLAAGWADNSGETAVAQTYHDIAIVQFDTLAFGRSDDLVLIGSSLTAVQQAIDAQGGESLADSALYTDAIAELPSDRLFTFFMDNAQVNQIVIDLFGEVFSGLAALSESPESVEPDLTELSQTYVRSTAVSISLVDEGAQIDSVTLLDPEKMTELERSLLTIARVEGDTAVLFPQDTLLYATGGNAASFWDAYRQTVINRSSQEDFEESMRLFAQEFGFNPETDFFPLLDGGLALGVLPGQDAALANLSGVAAVGVSDEAKMGDALTAINAEIGDPQTGMGVIAPLEADGLTLFELDSILLPDIKPVYGVGSGYLLLGTDAAAVQSLPLGTGASLADNGRFQQAWQSFPADLTPILFADVTGLLDWVEREMGADAPDVREGTAVLRPITAFAAAIKTSEETAVQRFIIFIDTGGE